MATGNGYELSIEMCMNNQKARISLILILFIVLVLFFVPLERPATSLESEVTEEDMEKWKILSLHLANLTGNQI